MAENDGKLSLSLFVYNMQINIQHREVVFLFQIYHISHSMVPN